MKPIRPEKKIETSSNLSLSSLSCTASKAPLPPLSGENKNKTTWWILNNYLDGSELNPLLYCFVFAAFVFVGLLFAVFVVVLVVFVFVVAVFFVSLS